MALADPQSITLATVAKSLVRTVTDRMSAVYALADGTLKLSVSHLNGRRNRTSIRLDQNLITTNPLNDVKSLASQSAYIVIDRRGGDFTNEQTKALVVALADYAKTANLDKILGYES
jgi:hypothetical protein